jgi:NAD-dependent dihydropyrimidine dehydrogenase PreA subunit
MAAKVEMEKCTGCGSCAEVCAVQAVKIDGGKAIINDECIECGACLNMCPTEALTM